MNLSVLWLTAESESKAASMGAVPSEASGSTLVCERSALTRCIQTHLQASSVQNDERENQKMTNASGFGSQIPAGSRSTLVIVGLIIMQKRPPDWTVRLELASAAAA